MTNNDVLRSLRYLLDIRDAQVAEITALAGFNLSTEEVGAFLASDDEPDFKPCSDRVLAHFLDGLIVRDEPTSRREAAPC